MSRVMQWGIIAALLLGSPLAEAQIVNVLSFADGTQAGWSGGLTGGLDWRTGNQALVAVRVNGTVGWRNERHHVFLMGRVEYGVQDEEVYLSRSFEHLRHRTLFLDVWALEVYLQHETDAFRRMELRVLAGVGLRRTVGTWDSVQFVVGSAWMPEYNLENGDSEGALVQRWSSYATMEIAFHEDVTFQTTVFAQPRFDDLGDVRISLTAGLQARVQQFVLIPFSLGLTHDSRPPEGVEPLDTTLQSSVGFEF